MATEEFLREATPPPSEQPKGLPPKRPMGVPDPAPTPPVGQSELPPAMAELAESVKNFRRLYQSRGQMPGSAKQVADLSALSSALIQRLLQEISKDPDYRLARTNPDAASVAQHNKAKIYDELVQGVVGIHQIAKTINQNLATEAESGEAPVEAQRVPARGSEELTEDEAQAGSATVYPPRPDFMKEGRLPSSYPGEGLSDEEMMEKHGKPKEKGAPEAAAEATQPDWVKETKPIEGSEQPTEKPEAKLAPRTSEEDKPEATAEVEAAEVEEEDSTPDWIKELGEEEDETINAYQRAQKERRAAVEKALAPKQEPIPPDSAKLGRVEPIPPYDPTKPPRVEPIPLYDPAHPARQVPLELGESQQPEEEFGETEVPEQAEAQRPDPGETYVPERVEESPPVGIYGEPLTKAEGETQWKPIEKVDEPEVDEAEVDEAEVPWDEEYGESQPDEEYGESQLDEEPSGPSPEMSTPEARKAAVEKAMRPKQAARPQSIKAPKGARIIKGDGGWSYAVMPNRDIRIIRAPKNHRPGMLLKAGSKGPWTAIANKFGIVQSAPRPEPTTKTEIKTTEPTSKTPKPGTKGKGVAAALKRLLSEGVEMPEDTPGA